MDELNQIRKVCCSCFWLGCDCARHCYLLDWGRVSLPLFESAFHTFNETVANAKTANCLIRFRMLNCSSTR